MFALREEIKQARETLDAQAAAWVAIVGEYDRSEQWCADGYGSVEGAIADLCHMDRGVVSMDVKLARKLQKLPVVAAAFAEGAISQRHASVIATAATPARLAEFTNLENEFVDVARKCPPKELADVVRYVTDALDGDGGADAEEKLYQRRRYHQSRTLDDMLATNGLLDPESAEFAESALKTARARDEREAETRTAGQRNADAFTMIMRQWLELTDANTPDHVRSQAITVLDLAETPGIGRELIAQAREERRRDGHLSRDTLERIACDANISRAIMFGKSEVLDLGRTTRIASPAQFRALIARDRHCQAPGCKEPPRRCQAHHKWWWTRGGPTDLDNLELLCWYHHRERHRQDDQARAHRDCGSCENPSRSAPTSVPPPDTANGPAPP
jgi:hypothetical protein